MHSGHMLETKQELLVKSLMKVSILNCHLLTDWLIFAI